LKAVGAIKLHNLPSNKLLQNLINYRILSRYSQKIPEKDLHENIDIN